MKLICVHEIEIIMFLCMQIQLNALFELNGLICIYLFIYF